VGSASPAVEARQLYLARGFTLVELLACVVILGVLATIAGPRFVDYQPFKERGYLNEVAAAMRDAQRVAVASGCDVRFTVTSTGGAAGYSAKQQRVWGANGACGGGWTLNVTRPDGTALSGSPPSNVVMSPSVQMVFAAKDGSVSTGTPPTLTVGSFTLNVVAGSGLVVTAP
jgi:MSHA pilin protein MshC